MPKSNSANAFRIHTEMMTTTGIWPKEKPNYFYLLKTFSSIFFAVGLITVQLIEALNDLNEVTKLSEIVYILITIAAYFLKLVIFMCRKEKFLNMLKHLKDPIFVSYPDDIDHYMVKIIKEATLVANIYRFFVICCVLLYLVYPILDHVPLPFPFPYKLGKYTLVMFAFQLTGEAYAAWNNSTLDTLCTSLMGIAAAHLDILGEKIMRHKKAFTMSDSLEISEKSDRESVKELKQCVEYHLAIIKFVDMIEQIFSIGIFAQFIASTLVICNTVFHFVLIPMSSQFFLLADYFVVMVMELFVYCWYGNEIIYKSQRIGEACYTSSWYLCSNEVRKYLFIIMERSKRPLKITTMNFSTLSLASFATILQWSYSFLALLLKMYYKRSASA